MPVVIKDITRNEPGAGGGSNKKKKTPKAEYAYGGKKMKMASYYSKGGTVFTGR